MEKSSMNVLTFFSSSFFVPMDENKPQRKGEYMMTDLSYLGKLFLE